MTVSQKMRKWHQTVCYSCVRNGQKNCGTMEWGWLNPTAAVAISYMEMLLHIDRYGYPSADRDDYVTLVWPVHGSVVSGGDRCIMKKDRIVDSIMPPKMDEIIREYQRVHISWPEMRDQTSLRFTGLTGNDLDVRQACLQHTKNHYLDAPAGTTAVPPPKAMPSTPSVPTSPLPSTTILPKPMPTARDDGQTAGRYRQGDGDIRNNPSFGSHSAPASKAARYDHASPVDWQSWQSSSWSAGSAKGSGKGKSESQSTSWRSPWNAWQANQRDRTQTWNWSSGGGK